MADKQTGIDDRIEAAIEALHADPDPNEEIQKITPEQEAEAVKALEEWNRQAKATTK